MTKINLPDWMPMADAAKLLGVSKVQVSRLVKSNRIVSQRIGVMVLVSRESVEAYRDSPRKPGRPATKPKRKR
jgi:excisionase family DNA binding protein